MSLRVYNTLTRKKEPFEPIDPPRVRMYVCGPTVYAQTHLGHARPAVAFDVIDRYLRYRGFELTHVRNITDIDDKIIAQAKEEAGADGDVTARAREIAASCEAEYLDMTGRLSVRTPDHTPHCTEHIPEMIEIIRKLEEKGLAYAADGDVYFSVRDFPGYGKLSGRDIDEMRSGARVAPGENKRDPLDFALWKAAKPAEPWWDSPWGRGRPGWHIECTAMSTKYLGEQIDIHGGGSDLVFPHHEDEVAQAEGATGKMPFVRYWLHNGFVMINKEKMSKSLGNFFTLAEIFQRYEPAAVRLFLISTHYRHPVDYTPENIDDATTALSRLRECSARLAEAGVTGASGRPVSERRAAFEEAMDDDFNTAGALGVIFELVRYLNSAMDAGRTGKPEFHAAGSELYDFCDVLGIDLSGAAYSKVEAEVELDQINVDALISRADSLADDEIDALLAVREKARSEKNWGLADTIRDALDPIINVKDGADGSVWKRK